MRYILLLALLACDEGVKKGAKTDPCSAATYVMKFGADCCQRRETFPCGVSLSGCVSGAEYRCLQDVKITFDAGCR